ncbi:hypothetical protein BU24DRAFT_363183 [Aaosphaeria arxii CBS 175.79]|uniref:SET domain-containing protein n=1 Tax=Aaosphaeria arxii CBS 175.79 TaxID=1450172 RepID=A0A6A5YBP5_9PLEO|nr:uncharacterized protein BU24DRAFT_363183 [Aaosphaeria arxii CBS 175.79]KAF2022131.1 hypothetical protein BU24DRAFT_363183 [Aaosphaeria arxii CBS 175.79]
MPSAQSPSGGAFKAKVEEIVRHQTDLADRPYSVVLRIQLAGAYKAAGYPDLAAGEAYKALLLIDEVVQDGEFHEEAISAAISDATSATTCDIAIKPTIIGPSSNVECRCISSPRDPDVEADEAEGVARAATCWSHSAYSILIGSLIHCGSLRSANDYNSRALRACPDAVFESYQEAIRSKVKASCESKGDVYDAADVSNYPEKGFVRRELYPWNDHEPNRYSQESIEFLNTELSQVAPRLEVKVASLPVLSTDNKSSKSPDSEESVTYVNQLGVFAKEDIGAGEEILKEKSLLTAVSRLRDSYCDACSAPLPKTDGSSGDSTEGTTILDCEECNEVFFCSEDCHDLAQESYHPSLCGVNVEQKVSASEAADALYSLLLIRALALAETQSEHPLDLKEVRYIWGDYHSQNLDDAWAADDSFGSIAQTLPFTFEANVVRPLNILEKMDVNIFEESHRYSPWVFNTLYAKFRGTASARQGPDGRPEIGAVHPLWCLANHSCDPNVAWEWQGSIRFWTREKLVEWDGRDPDRRPGILKGEEVLSHYCDIRLPVKERREWAVGALGGLCMCPRCVWEEAKEEGLEKSV